MIASVIEERVHFGKDIPAEVNACLQEAVACANDFERARELFYRARDMQPDQLEIYIALYKYFFYRGHIEEAREVVLDALQQSSTRGGFSADWTTLEADSTDWAQHDGPARVFLYSMKAYAFINLRLGNNELANQVLTKLQQLDGDDLVGASVIADLAEAV